MLNWKRVFPYLILNVIVSAATTLGVLLAWDAYHRSSTPTAAPAAAAVPANPRVTLAPTDQPLVTIEGVFGVGDLRTESLRLLRAGEGDLSLEGWQIQDGNGNQYTFPDINFINGAIEIYTAAGADSVIELHWGLDEAVWQPGETARVVDLNGNVRAEYTIP